MEWKSLAVEGVLSQYVLAFEQRLDSFNVDRYLTGIPLNPVLRMYGIQLRNIDASNVLNSVQQIIRDMPETEMPEWMAEAFTVVAQVSPMLDALSAQAQQSDVIISANDPYVPGLRARTVVATGIDGTQVFRDRRFDVDVVDVGVRRTVDLSIVHDDGTRALGEGLVLMPEQRRIYHILSGFSRSYLKQWWASLVEWLRMPTLTRTNQLNNIPIPEVRPSAAFPSRAMPFEAIASFGFFDAGVEISIESPKAQQVRIAVRDARSFSELGSTTVSINEGGEMKRVRLLSRGGLGRLPDLNIEVKPQYEAKIVNARVLSWFDVWTAR